MMRELTSFAEGKALQACSLHSFKGINLPDIKEKLTAMLGMIGRGGIFEEYTKHDISHVNGMLVLVDTIIPQATKELMTPAEWLLLVLSVYFHDLGMLVTKNEFLSRLSSRLFKDYRLEYLKQPETALSLNNLSSQDKEQFIYQEFVRSKHGDRIYSLISGDSVEGVPIDEEVRKIVTEMVNGMPPMFRKDLATVCRSHQLDDIENDVDGAVVYCPDQVYEQSNEGHANVFYVALILRTVDLLHITSDRTPSIEYRVIAPNNPKSQEEWAKQMAVTGITPKPRTDSLGNVDTSLQPDTLLVNALFQTESGYFALIDYLIYARGQLLKSFQIYDRIKKKYATAHQFPWRDIDDSAIKAEGFLREKLSFTIDQVKILDLLVGETLYNNHTVAIRELVQNAIDAVKVRKYDLGANIEYDPEVIVSWFPETRELIVSDNGTGMDLDIIKNYLLKVGSSRYQDPDFLKLHPNFHSISRFGIGLLTCFLIADDVDIITRKNEKDPPLLLKIRNLQGKYLLKYGEEKDSNLKLLSGTGTSIKLWIRPKIDNFNPEDQLKEWILFPDCKMSFVCGEYNTGIGFSSPKELIQSLLDDKKEKDQYKVACYRENGIDFAIALKRQSTLNAWMFVEPDEFINPKGKGPTPCGLCIEGIRINFDTPGYNKPTFAAYANLYGINAPQTNVARSGISSKSLDKLLAEIYRQLIRVVNEQKDHLAQEFSITWANDELGWLLSSLTRPNYFGSFLNDSIFEEQLSYAPVALIEEGGARHFCSYDEMRKKGHFWTVESESFSSVNRLIRELGQARNKAALPVLRAFMDKEDKSLDEIDVLFCEPNSNDRYLEEVKSSSFSVSLLRVIENQRRLDLKWVCAGKNQDWLVVDLEKRHVRGIGSERKLYIQQSDTVVFDVPHSHSTVRSHYGLFLSKKSPISEILLNLYSQLDMDKKAEYNGFLVVCAYVVYRVHVTEKEEQPRSCESFLDRYDVMIRDEVRPKLPFAALEELDDDVYRVYDTHQWYQHF